MQLEAGIPIRRRTSLWVVQDAQLKTLIGRWDDSFAQDVHSPNNHSHSLLNLWLSSHTSYTNTTI